MASCHDPYRELEIYLEQAEEEIGKAFEELVEYEANSRDASSSKWRNGESVLPPPPAFSSSSHVLCCNSSLGRNSKYSQYLPRSIANRVGYNGTILDLNQNSTGARPKVPLQKSMSCVEPSYYFSHNGLKDCEFINEMNHCNKNCVSTPKNGTFQKILRPSFSFPEGDMESVFMENKLCRTAYSVSTCPLLRRRRKLSECKEGQFTNQAKDQLYNRQRSVSVSSYPTSLPEDHDLAYPRPPSGDVNSLSAWADELVTAIDKTLSSEFNESADEFDYGLNVNHENKNDDHVMANDKMTSISRPNSCKFAPMLNGLNMKFVSPSPDSGIEHVCDTPDSYEDTVDASFRSCDTLDKVYSTDRKLISKSQYYNYDEAEDLIEYPTPPPPDFEDDTSNGVHPLRLNGKQMRDSVRDGEKSVYKQTKRDAETQVNHQILKTANSVSYVSDGVLLGLDSKDKEIHRQARVVPMVSMEFEDFATVTTTTCVVADVPWRGAIFNGINTDNECVINESALEHNLKCGSKSSSPKSSSDIFFSASDFGSDNAVPINSTEQDVGSETSPANNTLPKQVNRVKEQEYFCSLPRDTGKSHQDGLPDTKPRSSSSSAVSSLSQVSMDELAAFMRKVKSSTYYPPPRADVCVDVKDDNDDVFDEESNRDAVTQTTPVVPLSRSSSFTWVTECDCSDWDSSNAQSGSEGSPLAFSNSISDHKTAPSSSSLSLSTDDEGFEVPQNSYCSSLYLSACSDASDSSAESFGKRMTSDDSGSNNTKNSSLYDSVVAGQSVKSLSSAGTLMDIAEECPFNETVSLFSATSSQSDSPGAEQAASFPSTLKSIGKSRSTDDGTRPNQPIEANVLIVNELNVKSVSAPVLRQKRPQIQNFEVSSSSESSPTTIERMKEMKFIKLQPSGPYRAYSAKELNELQAIEACTWLRAAGFPQYAQMYDDNLFPVDITLVQKDHRFLHPDSIQSLFRRLNTLNRCARMKFDNIPHTSFHPDESDDDEQCALSENWEFQPIVRRWSRVPSPSLSGNEYSGSLYEHGLSPKVSPHSTPTRKLLTPERAYFSSHDSVFADETHSSPDSIRRCMMRKDEHCLPIPFLREGGCSPGSSSGSGGTLSIDIEDPLEKTQYDQQHNGGSGKIKEGAKAILKRMESLKGRKKKRAHDTKKLQNTNSNQAGGNSGTDGSSCSSLTSSPLVNRNFRIQVTSPQDHCYHIQGGTPKLKPKKRGFRFLHRSDKNSGAHSDSECPIVLVSEPWKDFNSMRVAEPGTSRNSQKKENISSVTQRESTTHLSVGTCSKKHQFQPETAYSPQEHQGARPRSPNLLKEAKLSNRASHYDNCPAPLVAFNDACVENLEKDQNSSEKYTSLIDQPEQTNNEGEIIIINKNRRDSGVGSSLTRSSYNIPAPWHSFPIHAPIRYESNRTIPVSELTAAQMLVLRKYALLKLTTLMEKYSPASRTGWSWAMPKFIRRIRSPDYKDKVIFGVPLLVMLQRTGEPLPFAIQAAFNYLKKTAFDSTGLFRKSGVRSRIQNLRILVESNPDKIDYEDQQAYDVADMLKQYFRELPEVIFTNKLSETFISVFQHIPEPLRLEAIQAAVILMPDENREVLQALLFFLQELCAHSGENQMTATNVAVCFAPSLFQLASSQSSSSSPRRRKTVGAPDLKELCENRAAYECLACMIANYKDLTEIPENLFIQSRVPCMDSYEPAYLGELGNLICKEAYGWKTYIECCIQTLMKEVRDKYKGWDNAPQMNGVEVAYQKVGDGYPLRLWKVSTEVEAPPTELLNRILRERHVWDSSFVKWRVIQTLEKQAEVFQFTCTSLPPHSSCDYCVIRAWKTDLPKGACILIEASVEHDDAKIMVDSAIRAFILASRFLIEPCGSGKSRITHFCRVDTRGRSPEWYNKAYGYTVSLGLVKLRDSFSHIRAVGPETKV